MRGDGGQQRPLCAAISTADFPNSTACSPQGCQWRWKLHSCRRAGEGLVLGGGLPSACTGLSGTESLAQED